MQTFSSKYLGLIFAFLLLMLMPDLVQGQTCNKGWGIGYTIVQSTCQSNGVVTLGVTGVTTGLNNINYRLKQIGGPLTFGPSNNNVFTGVPPGRYTVEVSAYCATDPSYFHTKSVPIQVGGNYKPPTIVLHSGRSRLSDQNCPSGIISLDVKFGLKPYTFRILEAPAGETVPIEPTFTQASTYFYDFDRQDYPAGHYKVEVEDACGYKTNTEFDLDGGDLLFTPRVMSSRFYADVDGQRGLDCNTLRYYCVAEFPAGTAGGMMGRLWRDGLYEVALAPTGQTPTNWTEWVRTDNGVVNFDMTPHHSQDFTAKNSLELWVRFKNCPTRVKSCGTFEIQPIYFYTTFEDMPCEQYRYYAQLIYGANGLFCYPLHYTITRNSDGAVVYDEPNWLKSTHGDGKSTAQLDYYEKYTLRVEDAAGQVHTQQVIRNREIHPTYERLCDGYNLLISPTGKADCTAPLIATLYSVQGPTLTKVCEKTLAQDEHPESLCGKLTYGKLYRVIITYPSGKPLAQTNILLYNQFPEGVKTVNISYNGTMRHRGNTRFLPTPNGRVFPAGAILTLTRDDTGEVIKTETLTAARAYFDTGDKDMPPGSYTLTADMNCGTPMQFHYDHKGYIDITNVSYTAVETCAGLEITPTATATFEGGPNLPDGTLVKPYFRLIRSVGSVNPPVVTNGGKIVLPRAAPGEYEIGVAAHPNVSMAIERIPISWAPKSLSLVGTATAAYACTPQGGTTPQGHILLKAEGGVPPYHFEVWNAANTAIEAAAPVVTSTTGETEITYGDPHTTYTIRVRDACGNEFPQIVTLLDFTNPLFAGTTTPNICAGDDIHLQCVNLGAVTYQWSGPNGWTSTEKNPIIPHAREAASGIYTVSVTLGNCGAPVSSSCNVKVRTCEVLVNPHLRSVPQE